MAGKNNMLRKFTSMEDLTSSVDQSVILNWINTFAGEREKRTKYNQKRQAEMKAAMALVKRFQDDPSLQQIVESSYDIELPSMDDLPSSKKDENDE